MEPVRIDSKLAVPGQKSRVAHPPSHAVLRAAARHIQEELKRCKAALPYSELVVVTAEGSGKALYQVVHWNGGVSDDVFLITYDVLGPLRVGGTAIMRRYPNGEPYLKGPGSSYTVLPTEDDPLEPVVPTVGQFLQTGGFWWEPFSALTAQRPMDDSIQVLEISYPPSSMTYDSFLHRVRLYLTGFIPVGTELDGSTSYVVDGGSPIVGGFGSASSGSDVWMDFSFPTEPTSVQLTLRFTVPASELVAGGDDANVGPISCRGVVMFPSGAAQMGAALTQTYTPRSAIYTPTPTSYTDNAPAEDSFAIPLRDTPAVNDSQDRFNTWIDYFVNRSSDFTKPIAYTVMGDALYAFLSFSSGIDMGISYKVISEEGDFTLNHSVGHFDSDHSDGAISEFVYVSTDDNRDFNLVAPSLGRDWSGYTCTDVQRQSDGLTIPFTQAGSVVTIDPTGLDPGVTVLRFIADFTWNTPYKFNIYPDKQVSEILSVTVNGVEDAGAAYNVVSGRQIITLSVTPGSGASVVVSYHGFNDYTFNDHFTGGAVVFHLSNVPVPGTAYLNLDAYPLTGYFPTGYATKIVVRTDVDYESEYADGRWVSVALKIPGDQNVEEGVQYKATYVYKIVTGNLYDFASVLIREFNATSPSGITSLSVPISGDATPVSSFPLGDPADSYQYFGWDRTRYGYLHYNPNKDSYTAVTPAGIAYRNRTATDSARNYTLSPWPEQANSEDPLWRGGWSYPANPTGWGSGGVAGDAFPPFKRRTAPHYGVSVMGRYALLGSWGAVASAVNFIRAPRDWGGGQGGNKADSAFPIYGFKQDKKTNVWGLIKALSPLDLVADNAKLHPTYMPGAGLVRAESGIDGNSYGHYGGGEPKNSWWPMTKDCKSWVIAAGWCEAEWGQTFRGITAAGDPNDYASFPYGHHDSGLTFNLVDPVTMEIQSQLTIKCDPNYVEGIFSEANALGYRFYSQEDVDHVASVFGATTFDLRETFVAGYDYGYYPGYSGLRFFFYGMNALDVPDGRQPVLRYPGIPSLASGNPRYADDYNGNEVRIGPEDAWQSQEMSIGDDGFLYVTLSIPYWLRIDDQTVLRRSETVTGTWVDPDVPFDCTPSIAGTTYDPVLGRTYYYLGNNRSKYISGWMGGPIVTGIGGPGAVTFSSYGPTTIQALPWSGFFSPFQDLINHVGFHLPIEQDLANPTHNTDTNGDDYISGYPGKANTCSHLEVPWYQDIPHRTWTTPVVSHNSGDPGITYTASTLGSGASLPPWSGVIVFAITGNQYRRYQKNARTFLFKISCANKTLTEVWRKDISFKAQLGPSFGNSAYGNPAPPVRTDNTAFFRAYSTKQRGRCIFVLRVAPIGTNPFLKKVVLEVYDSTSDPAVLLHTIQIPHDGYGSPNTPIPPENLEMMVGVDDAGNEWAHVCGFIQPVPGHGTPFNRMLVRMHANLSEDPTLIELNGDEPNDTTAPRFNDFRGVAQAANTWAWLSNRGDIYKRST